MISNFLEVTMSIVLSFPKLQMQMSYIYSAVQKAIVDMGIDKIPRNHSKPDRSLSAKI